MKTTKVTAFLAAALAVGVSSQAGQPAPEPFTQKHSIEMTTIGHPEYWHHNLSAGRVAHYSPDGSLMVMVLRRGNLETGETEYSLLLYRTKELMRVPAPQPEVLLRMATSSNHEIFASLQWLPDNRRLLFLGERPGETRQVFCFDLESRKLESLSESPTPVIRYSASADAQTLVYIAEDPPEPIWNERTRRDGLVVTDERLVDLIAGRHMPVNHVGGRMFVRVRGEAAWPLGLADQPDINFTPLVSPDGSYVLVRVLSQAIPPGWQGYTEPVMALALKSASASGGRTTGVCEYQLVDLRTGQARRLLDAPQILTHAGADAMWLAADRSVVISFLYLPLAGPDEQERQRRASTPFTAEVFLSGEIRPLEPFSIHDMVTPSRWDSRHGIMTLTRQSGGQPVHYKRSAKGWSRTALPRKARLPEVSLKEGLNMPPHIVVSDGGREQVLLDLNPHFKHLKLARQEEIEWQATDGTKVRGGLYYPPDFVRGRRYPLVIQTHGYRPDLFAADGIFVSANAAQALANRDMLVLQAWDFPRENNEAMQARYVAEKINKVAMHQFEQAVYEGAIDHLDAAGLIDRDKVGLIGFSFTAWSVKYVLSHPRPGYRFAAAATSDGFDGGYWNYVAHGNNPALAQQFETTAGGKPWGEGLQAWLKNAPGFNIDKVTTPIRMVPLGNPTSLLDDWEWFVLLKRMGRPVELVLVEHGTHSLVKPRDRWVNSGGNVDWFDFWLNGRKDPAPEKAEQYARWEEMKK